jgi:arabinofuranan 3-O-arabinosyltransferase
VVFVTNEPLAVGGVVAAGGNVNTVATAHVTVPAYWTSMADALNRSTAKGNVVVLPPDDFYQMPYTWGYYGSDGFIQDMISRNVLDPSGQGYWPGQQEVISAVDTIATAALTRNWYLIDQLMGALGTPYLLLRGDIDASYPGRTIIPPAELNADLERDPDLVVAHRDGPLVLFAAKAPARSPVDFATVSGSAPDLADLSVLPSGTALVSAPQIPGASAVIQPGPSRWAISGSTATMAVPERPGWTYATHTLVGTTADATTRGANSAASSVMSSVVPTSSGTDLRITFPVTTNLLPDANFGAGLWEPHVGDCDAVDPLLASTELTATVLHHAGPSDGNVLRLAAGVDTACESQKFALTTGTVLLSLRTRNLAGSGPRLCLYALGPDTCIALPPVPDTPSWTTYVASATPPPGTTGLALFLYADGPGGGSTSVDEYTDATVHNFSITPIILATPTNSTIHQRQVRLVTADSSYSSTWGGPAGSRHVLVDGMTNGWLVPVTASAGQSPGYRGTWMVASAALVTGAVLALLLLAGCLVLVVRRAKKHRRSGVPT